MNWTKRPPPRQGSESCSLEHIYAALAEKERAMISVRTKEELAREGQRRHGSAIRASARCAAKASRA
jgi:DNA invertase Pin-like site-specific DNA recombinase